MPERERVTVQGEACWAAGRFGGWASLVPRGPFLFSLFFSPFSFLFSFQTILFEFYFEFKSEPRLSKIFSVQMEPKKWGF
jgi:hypothetical protein